MWESGRCDSDNRIKVNGGHEPEVDSRIPARFAIEKVGVATTVNNMYRRVALQFLRPECLTLDCLT